MAVNCINVTADGYAHAMDDNAALHDNGCIRHDRELCKAQWGQMCNATQDMYCPYQREHDYGQSSSLPKLFFPDGSQCCNNTPDGFAHLRPPDCSCLYDSNRTFYTQNCCDKKPINWAGVPGTWAGNASTFGFSPTLAGSTTLAGKPDTNSLPNARKMFLIVWVALAALGNSIAAITFFCRLFPHLKHVPTDDSFRLTVVIKVGLMACKAGMTVMVQSEAEWEEYVVAMSYITSVALTALVTIAYQGWKAWQRPEVLQRIHRPKLFIFCYATNFLIAKAMAVHILVVTLRLANNICAYDFVTAPNVLVMAYGPSLFLLMYLNNGTSRFAAGAHIISSSSHWNYFLCCRRSRARVCQVY
jgi:hypothetical protein